jgi:hypothetical protein
MSKRAQLRPSNRRAMVRSNELSEVPAKKNALVSAPYYLAVDRQLKSGYDTYEGAEQAALAIKRQHPRLLVTVYEPKLRRHIAIEQPQVVIDLNGKRGASAQPNAIARCPASATKH